MRTLLRLFLLLVCLAVVAIALTVFIFRDRRPGGDKRVCDALETGNTNYLQQYLNSGGNVNRPVQFSRFEREAGPLLDVAIFNGRLGTVDFLLKHGANPNQRDSTGRTPLGWAIGSSRTEVSHETRVQIFKRLLQGGADPKLNVSLEEGYTPLHKAAFLGQSEMVSILLARGVSVSVTNSSGQSALHLAKNAEIAKELITAGADPGARAGGETPAESAARLGHFDALTVLTNTPMRTNAIGRQADH